MPAERRVGMDHDHYGWSPLPSRPPLRWPDGAQLAVCVVVLLEHYEWEPPADAYSLRRPSGGLFPLPYPDYVRLTQREYGHRVGVFRVLDVLGRHGVTATVAMDALTAQHYRPLARRCLDAGCELIGHGIAASRLITSRMSEADERATIATALDALAELTGARPTGWFSPEGAESARTPALLAEAGVRYVCDWPNDEQPYRMTVPAGPLLSLPQFLEVDDEFALWQRRVPPDRWATMLIEAAQRLHEDGAASGRLLVVTLRPWLIGQPFRIAALERAVGEITSWPGVWAANGGAIADWADAHLPPLSA